jgi:hypothetical protein
MYKRHLIFILLLTSFFVSCEKDEKESKLIGKWKLVKIEDMWASYVVEDKNQNFEEYTTNGQRILYDNLDNETVRCNFHSNDSIITIYGQELSGSKWETSYQYWFVEDSLKMKYDGGFECYNVCFVRVKK